MVAVLVMVYVGQDAPERTVAKSHPTPPTPPAAVAAPPAVIHPPKPAVVRPERPPRPEPRLRPPAKSSVEKANPPVDAVATVRPPEPPAVPPPVENEVPPPEPTTPVANDGATSANDDAGQPEMPSDEDHAGSPAPTTTGPSTPEKAKIAAKSKELRQLFKTEYATRDATVRAAFAQRLLRDAYDTRDDPVGAYVLATEARDQAMQGGDYETFTEAGRLLAERYGVDTHDEDIVALGKLQSVTGKSAEWYRGLLAEIDGRVDEAHARDDFDRATRYANVAKTIATKAGDAATAQGWATRIKDLATLKTQYGSYKAFKDTLRANPADATASAKWGTYLCLLKGNFADGMPYLIQGDDAVLATLAKREASPKRDAAETAAIADEWWALGEKSKAFRAQAWRHAGDLYESALPDMTGLAATKIQKRLEDLASAAAPRAAPVNAAEKLLTAGPWSVQWERPAGRRDPAGGGNNNEDNWTREETITFHEGGRIDSRYFDRYEIRSDFIELHAFDEEGPPAFAGGPPGGPRDRHRHGRAVLVGGELRLLYFRGDRVDDPRNRGIGTRLPAQ
jgi:hypothetical protein